MHFVTRLDWQAGSGLRDLKKISAGPNTRIEAKRKRRLLMQVAFFVKKPLLISNVDIKPLNRSSWHYNCRGYIELRIVAT